MRCQMPLIRRRKTHSLLRRRKAAYRGHNVLPRRKLAYCHPTGSSPWVLDWWSVFCAFTLGDLGTSTAARAIWATRRVGTGSPRRAWRRAVATLAPPRSLRNGGEQTNDAEVRHQAGGPQIRFHVEPARPGPEHRPLARAPARGPREIPCRACVGTQESRLKPAYRLFSRRFQVTRKMSGARPKRLRAAMIAASSS